MKTNLLLCAALCASITLSACGDDPVPASNNSSPDMNTPDMIATDMNTSDMNNPDMNASDMNASDMNMPDMDMPSDVTVDTFNAKFAAALCAKAQSCCTPAEYMDNFAGAGCETQTNALFAQFLPTADDVAAGKIAFDAAAAQGIINSLNTISCAEINMAPDIDLPYVGKVAEGDACQSSIECAAPAGKQARCDGSCVVPQAVGEACAVASECEQNLDCGPADTCVALLPAGADCSSGFDCSSMICGRAVAGKCDALLALGEDCSTSDECESGFCDFDTEVCIANLPTPPFCDGLF
jgi:hypothetical protein